MKILSSVREDVRHAKKSPCGYEWWYFDAFDRSGRFKLVIIFYEGIPFSLEYIQACEKANPGREALADSHPGLSISLYDNGKTIFYDLCEYPFQDCSFSETEPSIRLGPNRLETFDENNIVTYVIELHDKLPGGDILDGTITFSGKVNDNRFSGLDEGTVLSEHNWNLVIPKATVSAELNIDSVANGKQEIIFSGDGYHDHNLGNVPLYHTFYEWYWARFHFEKYSLVVYAMNNETQMHQAWMFENNNSKLAYTLSNIKIEDESLNVFFLKAGRRIIISGNGKNDPEIKIFLNEVLESGPFYMRFSAEAVLYLPGAKKIEKAMGIAEYIRPGRMTRKIFWPLVRMRLRISGRKPHPVQKFSRLYRWTW